MNGNTKTGSYNELSRAEISASEIRNLNIDWAAGAVDIEVYDGADVLLTETVSEFGKHHPMEWRVSGDTLKVSYGSQFAFFFFTFMSEKELLIQIPQDLARNIGSLDIDGASGTYTVSDINCDSFKVDLASGKLFTRAMNADAIKFSAASGTMQYNGMVSDSLKVDIASGKVDFNLYETCPKTMRVDLASGTIGIALPENDGFTVNVDSLTGTFNSDFELSEKGSGTKYYKDGGTSSLKVDMVSGKLSLTRSA